MYAFLPGEVRFYEGNYQESLSFLKEAQKDPGIAHNAREFYDFVNKIYQTTGKFKEVKTEHFLFRYVEDKDAILVDYALNTLEKAYRAVGNDLNYFPKEPVLVEVFLTQKAFAQSRRLPEKR